MTIEERQKYINDLQSKLRREQLNNLLEQAKHITRTDMMNTRINIITNMITVPLIYGASIGIKENEDPTE